MIGNKIDFQKKDFRLSKNFSAKRKNNNRSVLILFFGPIILSGIFWLQKNFHSCFQKFFQPTDFHISQETDNLLEPAKSLEKFLGFQPNLNNKENLEKSINFLIKNLQGVYGIYVYQLNSQDDFGINENRVYTAASVNKIPIMVNFYQQVEKGLIKEDKDYILARKDIQDYGTGQMRYQPLGTKYRYQQLIELAGQKSDNTAAYVLGKIVGLKTIQANLIKLGMKNTSLKDNTTTPKEMGKYFVKLYQGELLNEENKEKIFQALTKTDFEQRIPQGVPDKVRIAHKIGNEIQVYNDCGIVFNSNPYVLCILSDKVKQAEALEVIPKISRLIWEFENK